jgi:hypothetical protein
VFREKVRMFSEKTEEAGINVDSVKQGETLEAVVVCPVAG